MISQVKSTVFRRRATPLLKYIFGGRTFNKMQGFSSYPLLTTFPSTNMARYGTLCPARARGHHIRQQARRQVRLPLLPSPTRSYNRADMPSETAPANQARASSPSASRCPSPSGVPPAQNQPLSAKAFVSTPRKRRWGTTIPPQSSASA